MKNILFTLVLTSFGAFAQAADVCDVHLQHQAYYQSMTCTGPEVKIKPSTGRGDVVKAMTEAGYELKTSFQSKELDTAYLTLIFVRQ